MKTDAAFDAYAANYDAALARGVAVSGEDKEYFARGRLVWLARRLSARGERVRRVMDFGCGTGAATPFFFEQLNCEAVLGVDVSAQSIAIARATHGTQPGAQFAVLGEHAPAGNWDLVFCNGVFHHIPLADRPGALRWIHACLRPGGLLALWENNPWNPGAQIVMARIPFDRDAIKISPPAARRLVAGNGFDVLEITFQFIFPRFLKWLRGLETPLARWPFGAQYQVLARRL